MQKAGKGTLIFHANASPYFARERSRPPPPLTMTPLTADSGNDDDTIALKERDAAVHLRKHGYEHGHPGSNWRKCGAKRRRTKYFGRIGRPAEVKEAVAARSEFLHAQRLQAADLTEEQKTQKKEEKFYDDFGQQFPGALFDSSDLKWVGKHRAILPDTDLRVWIQRESPPIIFDPSSSTLRPSPPFSFPIPGIDFFHRQNTRKRQTRRRGQRAAKAIDKGVPFGAVLDQ
mmetsp:Transcript_80716/g.142965  ORF Transcript_80716/g.142965 Transcript_80716/m.142965 type:complete len:230 (-) Transcript_80716:399-1088(-)